MGLAQDWREPPDPRPPLRLEPSERVADSPFRDAIVRLIDVVGSLVLLVLASPLIALGAAIVLIGDGRPIFFGHVRVGQNRRAFKCWKIRTMHADAEEQLEENLELNQRYLAHGFKLPAAHDPRLLPGGAWLRRRYVDELPQLWNVLKGEMSLVGPRPVVLDQLETFGEDAHAIVRHRPGLFGEWTSRGRTRPPFPERVQVEMQYVNDPSLMRTARILLRSVGAVLTGQGEEG